MAQLCDLLERRDASPEDIALAIAADEYPSLDTTKVLDEIIAWAHCLRQRIDEAGRGPQDLVPCFRRYVFEDLGFRGDEDYDEPRANYLSELMRRRRGSPVAMAVLLMALGSRAGVLVEPIGFPGHFLVRVEGKYMDPCDGGYPIDRERLLALAVETRAALRNRSQPTSAARSIAWSWKRAASRGLASGDCLQCADAVGAQPLPFRPQLALVLHTVAAAQSAALVAPHLEPVFEHFPNREHMLDWRQSADERTTQVEPLSPQAPTSRQESLQRLGTGGADAGCDLCDRGPAVEVAVGRRSSGAADLAPSVASLLALRGAFFDLMLGSVSLSSLAVLLDGVDDVAPL